MTARMTAFDPISLAVAASVIENACHPQPKFAVPRAKVWLRRQAKPLANSVLQEAADPVLNAINHIDPRLGVMVLAIVALRCLVHMKFDVKREPFWLCIAAYTHVVVALLCHELY